MNLISPYHRDRIIIFFYCPDLCYGVFDLHPCFDYVAFQSLDLIFIGPITYLMLHTLECSADPTHTYRRKYGKMIT